MATSDAVSLAREELMPLFELLDRHLDDEGQIQARGFFARIRELLALARAEEDLAVPFMELAASAFVVGSAGLSPVATLLIDRILESAQTISTTLSASAETAH